MALLNVDVSQVGPESSVCMCDVPLSDVCCWLYAVDDSSPCCNDHGTLCQKLKER